MKTRSVSGVGQKVDLAVDIDTLRIQIQVLMLQLIRHHNHLHNLSWINLKQHHK